MVNNSGVFTLFEEGDELTRCDQGIISRNNKTIDIDYAVHIFTMEKKTKSEFKSKIKGSIKLDYETDTKLGNETSTKTSFKLGSGPNTKLRSKTSAKTDFTPFAMQPIFHVDSSSAFESLYHNVGEEIVLIDSTVIDQDQGRQGWYNQLDHFVFLEELVISIIPEYTNVTHNNILTIF